MVQWPKTEEGSALQNGWVSAASLGRATGTPENEATYIKVAIYGVLAGSGAKWGLIAG